MGLNGSIESVMDKKYEADEKFGEAVKSENIIEAIEYRLDEKGNIERQIHYSDNGNPYLTLSNEYNEQGRIVLTRIISAVYIDGRNDGGERVSELIREDGDNYIYIQYYTDKPNDTDTINVIHEKRLVSSIIKKHNGDIRKEVANLDSKGNTVGIKILNNDILVHERSMKYNKSDLIESIDKVPMNPDRDQIVYTYKYTKRDVKGNWIERIEYEDNEAEYVTVREIIYKD